MDHVMFHADIDGIMSAALFLHSADLIDREYKLYPLLSSTRGDKFKAVVKKMKLTDEDSLSIFDFEHHERANLWIDHHPNQSLGHDPVSTERVNYDPRCKSTFELVFRHFKDTIKDSDFLEHLNYLQGFVNMVDSASYPNAGYIFNDETPGMIMYAYLETSFPSEMMFSRFVEIITRSNLYLPDVVSTLNITPAYVEDMRDRAKEIKHRIEIYGNFSLVRQKRIHQYPRYSENYVVPDIKYNIRI